MMFACDATPTIPNILYLNLYLNQIIVGDFLKKKNEHAKLKIFSKTPFLTHQLTHYIIMLHKSIFQNLRIFNLRMLRCQDIGLAFQSS